MAAFFLACAVLGASVLLLQFALGLVGVGADTEVEPAVGSGVVDGFDLLTVRGLAAGTAFFGIAGRAALAWELGTVPATLVALATGSLAAAAVAIAMRLMRRLESDGAVHIHGAVGLAGTVHVRVPGGADEQGKVLLTLQNRLVEFAAVSLDGDLPTGTAVTVVGVASPDTLEVVRTPDPGA